jgi:peptidoglycan DL-endopeptidase CwlO
VAATLLRRLTAAVGLITALLMAVVLAVATPASAAPKDPEGGTKTLREALESAAKGHSDAQIALKNSQRREKQLNTTLLAAQVEARQLEGQVAAVASRSYRLGRFNTVSMLLNASSPDGFLERMQRLDQMAQVDARALAQYRAAVNRYTRARQAIALEIKEQQKQVTVMAKKKKQAEQALASVGGGAVAGGFVSANSPLAKPAPRNSDGSWPKESCTINDPTTSGCVTPRLLHAYQESRADGFKRYTSCFSQRSSGEHPQGRACDFSASTSGFKNVNASGGDKAYGDRLAAYYVKNASRLGVMYVIWFRQIWMPSTGWRSYSGSGGPSATHTNHLHLSVL